MLRRSSRLPWPLVIVLLAVSVLPSSAHAQSDFDRYLTAIQRLYEAKEYKRALEQLQRTKKASTGDEQDAVLLLYEGIILGDMGQRDESLKAFESALLLQPEAQLPFKVSSKMTRDFETIRARVQKELKGELWARPQGSAPDKRADAAASGSREPVATGKSGAPSEDLAPVASLPELESGGSLVEAPEQSSSPQVSPQLFGFVDPLGKSFGAGGGLTVGLGSLDLGARVLLGTHVGVGAEAGLLLGSGTLRPRVGLRGTAIPGSSAYGGGAVAGLRLSATDRLTLLLDVGAEYLAVQDKNLYRTFFLTSSAGVGFDLL
ncbi:MAG TPA: tetratricopeptide repeat protein [Myxococcaceae bacterium]|jgi:hypothetical protein